MARRAGRRAGQGAAMLPLLALGFRLSQRAATGPARFRRNRLLFCVGVWLATAVAFAWPQGASAAATTWVGDDHAAARLIAAVEATGSGSTVDAGLEIRLMPGWHTYWRSPGDAGIPPSIEWAGSTNLAACRDRLAGAGAPVASGLRDGRLRRSSGTADRRDLGAAGRAAKAARGGQLCRLLRDLRTLFGEFDPRLAGRSRLARAGGAADRRGPRAGPRQSRSRRFDIALGHGWQRPLRRRPGRAAAGSGRAVSSARTLRRRSEQGVAGSADGRDRRTRRRSRA